MPPLKLDPSFVAKMEGMLKSRLPAAKASVGTAAKGHTPPSKKAKKKAAAEQLLPAQHHLPTPASKPSDLFVIDRSVMEELVSTYVARHVQALQPQASGSSQASEPKGSELKGSEPKASEPPSEPSATGAHREELPKPATKQDRAKFVVQRVVPETGRVTRKTVSASHLRSDDRILHMIID